MSRPSMFRRIFAAIWRGITLIRLALANILFVLILVLMYVVYVGPGPEPLPEKAALLLDVRGTVVDQRSQVDPLQAFMGQPSPADYEVLLRDLVDAIDIAAEDPAVSALVMELDYLVYLGLSKTQELARALEGFKATGKPMVAVGDYYTQDQYLLASFAETIIMHPGGGVGLEGFASYQNYFRDALEKLALNVHVFRAGEHKSIAEPILRSDMSAGERAISQRWLNVLWGQYTAMVEEHRDMESGTVDAFLAEFDTRVAGAGGDLALLAEQAGFIDERMGREAANAYLIDLVGAKNEEGRYQALPFEYYLDRKRPSAVWPEESKASRERVAVITAQGAIQPGDQPPGTIGGDSLGAMISHTIEQDDVAALVLRVNSGGGSVFASEVIRQRVLEAKAAGLPVVVSMGAVAASGGYYIAADADQIWATPGTITGSIGVFAAVPTVEQLMERLGVYTDGVGTTPLAGSSRLDRPLNPLLGSSLTNVVNFIYREFVGLVAEGRGMSFEAVDALAQGRVWSAEDAMANGLLDGLGTLEDAVTAAAELAGLEDYEVDYVSKPLSPQELLFNALGERFGQLQVALPVSPISRLSDQLMQAVSEWELLNDPGHVYVRCLGCNARL
ncbi:MAG: signal peptide peptidase SppA [Pseudomonadota bacterium]